jgi:hypothetical protein
MRGAGKDQLCERSGEPGAVSSSADPADVQRRLAVGHTWITEDQRFRDWTAKMWRCGSCLCSRKTWCSPAK